MENCEICDKPGKYIGPLSTIRTCVDHSEYASIGQIEVVQKKLGIISEYSDKMMRCFYCDSKLTDEEVNSISINDQNICCTKHSEVRNWYQLDMAKIWLKFKEENPAANYSDRLWNSRFREFWKKHTDL